MNGHTVGIPPESSNVVLHPLEREALIKNAIVARSACLCPQLRQVCEPECAQPVVQGHHLPTRHRLHSCIPLDVGIIT